LPFKCNLQRYNTDLTVLATDIPDLKSRLGIADDGLAGLSLDLIGERIVRTTQESVGKAKEGAEFMARGVKMLGADMGASGGALQVESS
jgi:hypothetical protein